MSKTEKLFKCRLFPARRYSYSFPIGTLVRGNAKNGLGLGWFWIAKDDWMKSFRTKRQAVGYVFSLLKQEVVGHVEAGAEAGR